MSRRSNERHRVECRRREWQGWRWCRQKLESAFIIGAGRMNVLGPYMPEPTPASTPNRKHQIEMQCHRLRTSYMKRRFPIPQTVCKERLKRNHENNRDSTEDGKQILPRNIRLGLGKRESIKERKQIPRRKSRVCLRLAQMVVRSETTV